METIELNHGTLEYRAVGPVDSSHPPVLFVHGALVDGRLWDSVADSLAARGYRCILPTLPLGSQRIPAGPTADLSPRGLATMIRDFAAALHLDDVTLVGNDTGGALCQFAIDAHPEFVGRLVLTNCDAFDTFPPFPFNALFALGRFKPILKPFAVALSATAIRHSAIGFGLLATRPDPELTRSWLTPARESDAVRADLAALARTIKPAELDQVTRRLGTFDKPVSVVWGMKDKCFKPALGRRLAAQFPNATFTEVPDARTFVSLDEPDAVVRAVENISASAQSSS
ncbi:alpha/beta fold hydrolase [Williamsia sp. R60]